MATRKQSGDQATAELCRVLQQRGGDELRGAAQVVDMRTASRGHEPGRTAAAFALSGLRSRHSPATTKTASGRCCRPRRAAHRAAHQMSEATAKIQAQARGSSSRRHRRRRRTGGRPWSASAPAPPNRCRSSCAAALQQAEQFGRLLVWVEETQAVLQQAGDERSQVAERKRASRRRGAGEGRAIRRAANQRRSSADSAHASQRATDARPQEQAHSFRPGRTSDAGVRVASPPPQRAPCLVPDLVADAQQVQADRADDGEARRRRPPG